MNGGILGNDSSAGIFDSDLTGGSSYYDSGFRSALL